jgi:regulator of replication initiation timing
MAVEMRVATPAGDELPVYSDAQLAELLGPHDKRVLSANLSLSWVRGPILLALYCEGAVEDASGRASGVLFERAKRYGLRADIKSTAISNALDAPAFDLLVERRKGPRKTYSIRLVGLAERWLRFLPDDDEIESAPTAGADATGSDDAAATTAPEPEPEDCPGGTVGEPGDASARVAGLAPAPSPVEFELTNAVATALLTQVVEIISTGAGAGPQLGRLQLDVQALEERLGTQVAYVDKLRRQVREAGDEITALRVERDGLRQRVKSAEHNLTVAMSADAQRIIDAEVQRQLDRIMRQSPNGEHSKRASSIA